MLFADLYAATFPEVLAYCRRRADTPEDANDAVGEVYVVAWRKLNDATSATKPVAWLIAVARGVLLNQRRGHSRRGRLIQRLSRIPQHLGIDAATVAQSRGEVAAVFQRLGELAPLDQEIVALAAFEELSHDEIGGILDLTPAAVKTRLYRARQQLQQPQRTKNGEPAYRDAPPFAPTSRRPRGSA